MTVEQALAHPTWAMGGKITIDSATLMNKGLEVIEAHWLFGTPYEQIDVVVHPQSIVHALVSLCDGATLAHLGHPDMRVPIAYALHHPDRVDVPVRTLDLAQVGALTFEPPDLDAFPCLRLSRDAALAGGTATCVLNAANEVAVHAFLGGALDFMGIPAVIETVLEQLPAARVHSFDTLYAADAEARRLAAEAIGVLRGARMSWLLAFLGFALLIILHELGHFTAAKAVGMRVERFALFFPPLLGRVRRGETEYAIGAIPLGGYVRITGMNPAEEIPPDVAHRAYYRQPVWKRIVVIGAGPAVNIVLAFLLLAAYLLIWGVPKYTITNEVEALSTTRRVGAGAAAGRPASSPSTACAATPDELRDQVSKHTCAGHAGRRLRRDLVGARDRRARRRAAELPHHADLQRAGAAAAARLLLRLGALLRPGRRRRRGREHLGRPAVVLHDDDREDRSPASSTPRSARTSPASSAPTRRRGRRSSSPRTAPSSCSR